MLPPSITDQHWLPITLLRFTAGVGLIMLTACTSVTSNLESAAEAESGKSQTTNVESGPSADRDTLTDTAAQPTPSAGQNADKTELAGKPTIIQKPATVTQRGTNIEAIVNGRPITNYDVQRRTAFLRLRRVGGDRSEKALEELVEEAIKLQEARRVNLLASDEQVDEAFGRFASNNRMSKDQLSQVLGQAGVSASHFKDYIRSQISWQRIVGSRFRAETQNQSTQEAVLAMRRSGQDRPETNEYILQQVIFVIPSDKRKAMLSQRRQEAYAFKQQFTSCDQTAKQAVGLLDVTVRDLPRVLEPQLPEEWAEAVIAAKQGQTTDLQNTDRGVEFIAICSKKTVADDNAVKVIEQAQQFEEFNERGGEVAEKYLAELKSRAQIIYR
jgi:peptidyl-prolyl cis-trans isomerase SurA